MDQNEHSHWGKKDHMQRANVPADLS
ncbi:GTPase, IMAP family member 2, isoform CRA_d [Homo sapiens]|nr:GTPase, IMAP family member 2, isoform CRA_d [Homo sapiens]